MQTFDGLLKYVGANLGIRNSKVLEDLQQNEASDPRPHSGSNFDEIWQLASQVWSPLTRNPGKTNPGKTNVEKTNPVNTASPQDKDQECKDL